MSRLRRYQALSMVAFASVVACAPLSLAVPASAAVITAAGPTRAELAALPCNCGYIHDGNQYMDDYGGDSAIYAGRTTPALLA
jgi:hypothetical protein